VGDSGDCGESLSLRLRSMSSKDSWLLAREHEREGEGEGEREGEGESGEMDGCMGEAASEWTAAAAAEGRAD